MKDFTHEFIQVDPSIKERWNGGSSILNESIDDSYVDMMGMPLEYGDLFDEKEENNWTFEKEPAKVVQPEIEKLLKQILSELKEIKTMVVKR